MTCIRIARTRRRAPRRPSSSSRGSSGRDCHRGYRKRERGPWAGRAGSWPSPRNRGGTARRTNHRLVPLGVAVARGGTAVQYRRRCGIEPHTQITKRLLAALPGFSAGQRAAGRSARRARMMPVGGEAARLFIRARPAVHPSIPSAASAALASALAPASLASPGVSWSIPRRCRLLENRARLGPISSVLAMAREAEGGGAACRARSNSRAR